MRKKKKHFTLTELLIAVIILGVLAAMAIPIYNRAVIASKNRETIGMLELMYQAQEMYGMETGAYRACGDTAACNAQLYLAMPTGGSAQWTYSAKTYAGDTDFCVQSTSTGLNPPTRTARYRRNGPGVEPDAACP